MKLAARRDYETSANWKVVVENGSECYHCALNHPELCKVYDPWGIDYVENIDAPGGNAVAAVLGADVGARTLEDMTFTPAGERVCAVPSPRLDEEVPHARELWWQPGNALSLTRDSGFLFTVRPSGPNRTMQTQFWLVHEDAREGSDYTLEQLMRLMVVTQDEDRTLCEEVQRGLEQRRYTPGPLNLHYQAGQIEFYRWYESRLLQFEQQSGRL